MDETTLQEIAEMTGGKYFRAKDAATLEKIYAEVDKLEPIKYEEEHDRPVTLLYMYPLAVAMALMMGLSLLSVLVSLIRKMMNDSNRNKPITTF